MKIPAGEARCELVVRRSRFLGYACGVRDAGEAHAVVERERLRHPGCDHVTHAFVLGSGGEQCGMSDDQEPKGTAGRPMLEVLRGSGLTNVVAVVTRFFGGTKLGTGGLAHSYADTVKELLRLLPARELVERCTFVLRLPYELYDRASRILSDCGGESADVEFGVEVTLCGSVPLTAQAAFAMRIADLSGGRLAPEFSARR